MKVNWRYTLGEILIVFVGITIAFGLNKCSENSKEALLRHQYLSNIKNDIEQDRALLKQNLDSIDSKITLSTAIVPVLNSDSYTGNKIESIGKIFNFIGSLEFIPNDNTCNALINSGDYNLIDKFNLKKAIEAHYSYYEKLEKDYKRIENIQKTYVGDYFINHIDYDALSQGRFGFEQEKLLKNIVISLRGAYLINLTSTKTGIRSCDSLIKILSEEL